jgi:hypothetical protein
VAIGKGKTGTIPAFAVGRATWEACSGNWERKNGNIPAFAVGRATWEVCSGNWERKNGNIPAFAVGRATWEVCSGNWERKNGNIPAFALVPRKTKKTCVEMAGHRTFRLPTASQPSGIYGRSNPIQSN